MIKAIPVFIALGIIYFGVMMFFAYEFLIAKFRD